MTLSLPIDDVIGDIRARLREDNRLVLSAPPGAGKTTRIPLALLQENWTKTGKILVLEPRRIAARAAASRMASTLGEKVGETVGLRARMDVRTSDKTRIEVLTEGVFTRQALNDPELSGVSAVLFDEFHERSLEADLGLALALDIQSALREDLRIMPMSATLETERLSAFLGARTVSSDGRAHPVETRYLERIANGRLEQDIVRAVKQALREETGSILVFLPGAAEIKRSQALLDDLPDRVHIAPLFGGLSPKEQDAAIQPASSGIRKVVLATDIAESSLTIEGVRIVIDAGLARIPQFDPQLGVSRLETRKCAKANADQRRGRAGRTEPGVCYRLWREAETRGLLDAPAPEIANADLSGLVLDLAHWGATDPQELMWLDPPPDGRWRAARDRLVAMGALNDEGRLTPLGEQLSKFPLPPQLALMIMKNAEHGDGALAADVAALFSERGLGGRDPDLKDRLSRFHRDKSQRASGMAKLSKRWANLAGAPKDGDHDLGLVVGRGFPEQIAKARPGKPGEYLMANGRGAKLDPDHPLCANDWLAIGELTGGGATLRIMSAAALSEADAQDILPPEDADTAEYDVKLGKVSAKRVRRMGAIILSQSNLPKPEGELTTEALLEAVRTHGLEILPSYDPLTSLIDRIAFLHQHKGDPWVSDYSSKLINRLEDWLAPLLSNARDFSGVSDKAIVSAAKTLLDWPLPQDLDKLAPTHWKTPTGRNTLISYQGDNSPTVSVRVQEVYGLSTHPMIANGRVSLGLELLSPAQRPVAFTRDITGFWSGGYGDMRKDMRGRYPKHDWPEDPANAKPQTGAKRRN